MNAFIAFLVLSVGAVLLMQYLAVRRARRAEGRPAPDTMAVDGPACADRLRVYYFYSQHCGPCRSTTPLVERLQSDHRNLIKVDVTLEPDLTQAFGIAATPCFVQVEGGEIKRVYLGSQSEGKLRSLLHDG